MKKTINTIVLHRVVENDVVHFTDINVASLKFLLALCSQNVCSLDEAFLKDGDISRQVCLTFDDGNLSDFERVLPLLLACNVRATFFIVTDFIGTPDYMDICHIKELHRKGMQIGSHSVSHTNFLKLTKTQRFLELQESKNVLEEITGSKITSFSFPYGFFNKDCVKQVFEAGYSICCNSQHGISSSTDSEVCRNSINAKTSMNRIRKIVNANVCQRLLWYCEDRIKSIMKSHFSSIYIRLRNLLFKI